MAGALLLGALGIARTMDGMLNCALQQPNSYIDLLFKFNIYIVHCDAKADLIPGNSILVLIR